MVRALDHRRGPAPLEQFKDLLGSNLLIGNSGMHLKTPKKGVLKMALPPPPEERPPPPPPVLAPLPSHPFKFKEKPSPVCYRQVRVSSLNSISRS